MPDLGDVGQMFGLEVPRKTVTSQLLMPLPVGHLGFGIFVLILGNIGICCFSKF